MNSWLPSYSFFYLLLSTPMQKKIEKKIEINAVLLRCDFKFIPELIEYGCTTHQWVTGHE